MDWVCVTAAEYEWYSCRHAEMSGSEGAPGNIELRLAQVNNKGHMANLRLVCMICPVAYFDAQYWRKEL